MSENTDDKKQKSKMLEIRDILKNQVKIYSNLHETLTTTSKGFDKIDDAYSAYGSEIGISGSHITKLKKREYFENLFIYVGFVFFFICVALVLLKRFPIHHLLYTIYNLLDFILSSLSSTYSLINQHFFKILLNNTNITNGNSTEYYHNHTYLENDLNINNSKVNFNSDL
jgi:hypothetical protein